MPVKISVFFIIAIGSVVIVIRIRRETDHGDTVVGLRCRLTCNFRGEGGQNLLQNIEAADMILAGGRRDIFIDDSIVFPQAIPVRFSDTVVVSAKKSIAIISMASGQIIEPSPRCVFGFSCRNCHRRNNKLADSRFHPEHNRSHSSHRVWHYRHSYTTRT